MSPRGTTTLTSTDIPPTPATAGRRACSVLRQQPLERVLFALAGTVTLLSAVLAATVSRWFLILAAFVGVNQWLYVLAGRCPASIVIRRVLHLQSALHPTQPAGADRPQPEEATA